MGSRGFLPTCSLRVCKIKNQGFFLFVSERNLTFPLDSLTPFVVILVEGCQTIIRHGRIGLYLKTIAEQQQRLGNELCSFDSKD